MDKLFCKCFIFLSLAWLCVGSLYAADDAFSSRSLVPFSSPSSSSLSLLPSASSSFSSSMRHYDNGLGSSFVGPHRFDGSSNFGQRVLGSLGSSFNLPQVVEERGWSVGPLASSEQGQRLDKQKKIERRRRRSKKGDVVVGEDGGLVERLQEFQIYDELQSMREKQREMSQKMALNYNLIYAKPEGPSRKELLLLEVELNSGVNQIKEDENRLNQLFESTQNVDCQRKINVIHKLVNELKELVAQQLDIVQGGLRVTPAEEHENVSGVCKPVLADLAEIAEDSELLQKKAECADLFNKLKELSEEEERELKELPSLFRSYSVSKLREERYSLVPLLQNKDADVKKFQTLLSQALNDNGRLLTEQYLQVAQCRQSHAQKKLKLLEDVLREKENLVAPRASEIGELAEGLLSSLRFVCGAQQQMLPMLQSALVVVKKRLQSPPQLEDVCYQCKKSGATSRCGKCKHVCYCGEECQVLHWKGGHRRFCYDMEKVSRAYAIMDPLYRYNVRPLEEKNKKDLLNAVDTLAVGLPGQASKEELEKALYKRIVDQQCLLLASKDLIVALQGLVQKYSDVQRCRVESKESDVVKEFRAIALQGSDDVTIEKMEEMRNRKIEEQNEVKDEMKKEERGIVNLSRKIRDGEAVPEPLLQRANRLNDLTSKSEGMQKEIDIMGELLIMAYNKSTIDRKNTQPKALQENNSSVQSLVQQAVSEQEEKRLQKAQAKKQREEQARLERAARAQQERERRERIAREDRKRQEEEAEKRRRKQEKKAIEESKAIKAVIEQLQGPGFENRDLQIKLVSLSSCQLIGEDEEYKAEKERLLKKILGSKNSVRRGGGPVDRVTGDGSTRQSKKKKGNGHHQQHAHQPQRKSKQPTPLRPSSHGEQPVPSGSLPKEDPTDRVMLALLKSGSNVVSACSLENGIVPVCSLIENGADAQEEGQPAVPVVSAATVIQYGNDSLSLNAAHIFSLLGGKGHWRYMDPRWKKLGPKDKWQNGCYVAEGKTYFPRTWTKEEFLQRFAQGLSEATAFDHGNEIVVMGSLPQKVGERNGVALWPVYFRAAIRNGKIQTIYPIEEEDYKTSLVELEDAHYAREVAV